MNSIGDNVARRQYPHPRTLDTNEFERAIWLDFEGTRHTPLVFAGYVIDGEYECVILDSRSKILEEFEIAYYCEPRDFLDYIFEEAERQERPIIGYSKHEYDVIKNFDSDYTSGLNKYYRNANKLAKRYFSPNHKNSLKAYLKSSEIGYDYPDGIELNVPTIISTFWGNCDRFSELSDMPNGRRKKLEQKLKNIVEYNKHDCLGMQHLIRLTLD